MNYGKAGEPSSSRSRFPSTARSAAISATPTATLLRSDRARTLPTASARPRWNADSQRFPMFSGPEQSLAPRPEQEYQMDGANGLKQTTQVATPVASSTLSVNVFTAPGKTMVGERPRPFGEALGFDPITSTLIFGEYDAVLV